MRGGMPPGLPLLRNIPIPRWVDNSLRSHAAACDYEITKNLDILGHVSCIATAAAKPAPPALRGEGSVHLETLEDFVDDQDRAAHGQDQQPVEHGQRFGADGRPREVWMLWICRPAASVSFNENSTIPRPCCTCTLACKGVLRFSAEAEPPSTNLAPSLAKGQGVGTSQVDNRKRSHHKKHNHHTVNMICYTIPHARLSFFLLYCQAYAHVVQK